MESLPGTMYQIEDGDDVGDLEFIQEKVLANDYFQVSGDINALNSTIEHIIPNGKRAFLIEAKITMSANPGATGSDQTVAQLSVDGVRKSKAKIGKNSQIVRGLREPGGAGWGTNSESRFNVLGLSVVGDGVKKIEIINVLAGGSAFAEMTGYYVDV